MVDVLLAIADKISQCRPLPNRWKNSPFSSCVLFLLLCVFQISCVHMHLFSYWIHLLERSVDTTFTPVILKVGKNIIQDYHVLKAGCVLLCYKYHQTFKVKGVTTLQQSQWQQLEVLLYTCCQKQQLFHLTARCRSWRCYLCNLPMLGKPQSSSL